MDGPTAPIRLRYKPMAMERVFRNLLDNAATYGKGHIRLRMELQSLFVEIMIRDFGSGVEPALLSRLGRQSPPVTS